MRAGHDGSVLHAYLPVPGVLAAAASNLLLTVPLAARRRAPLTVLGAQFVGAAGVALGSGSSQLAFVAIPIGVYSLAAHGRRPWVSIGALLAIATGVAVVFGEVTPPMPGWASAFAILLPIGLFGTSIRATRARADAFAQRAEALRAGQEAATRAAVARERTRIARELHDVVSHHVSVMVIQAGAAHKVIDSRPDLARGSLGAIKASGQEAMSELRDLLGVLAPAADGDDDEEPLRPQPGLDHLDALVDKVRAAGQPVSVRHTPMSLRHGVDIAAYRVIQEALTNALRYAPGARTTVVAEQDGDILVVEVTDDGTADCPTSLGTGSGLVGLAERLRLYGGTLETGRRLGGGFRVTARIPLEAA
jgi:signal transduction histidine kinase